MFLHYLLNRKEDELISKIFWAQKEQPTKNDWYSTVMQDLKEFSLYFLDLSEIKNMKKDVFKKTVKEKCKEISLKYLLEDNDQKSKLKNLKYYQLQLQPYLMSKKITTRQKKLLFRFRTIMVKVGHNYGKRTKCPLCKLKDDTQEHLFQCVVLKLNCSELYNAQDEKYQDIFSMNQDTVIKVAKICESIVRKREEILS